MIADLGATDGDSALQRESGRRLSAPNAGEGV